MIDFAIKLPIYKFTRLEYAQEFVRGHIRVVPASSYYDPSLNPAIRDNELEVTAIRDGSQVKIYAVNQTTLESEREIPAIGDVEFKLESSTDYYVLCFSGIFDPRLYGDFGANACIVINDHVRFVNRIFEEFERYPGKWSGGARFVTYYEPKTLEKLPKSVFFHKTSEYQYQCEYRIAILPPKDFEPLKVFFMEIGDISSYCEIIHN